jgi:hypothetical protein
MREFRLPGGVAFARWAMEWRLMSVRKQQANREQQVESAARGSLAKTRQPR